MDIYLLLLRCIFGKAKENNSCVSGFLADHVKKPLVNNFLWHLKEIKQF